MTRAIEEHGSYRCVKLRYNSSRSRSWSFTGGDCVSVVGRWECGALVEWLALTGKPKFCERNLWQCHFLHHVSHID